MLSINPDAHALSELHYADFGIIMGQKGGLTAENCLNCLPLDQIKDWFDKRKREKHK
jgi:DNA polymerase (family 10)